MDQQFPRLPASCEPEPALNNQTTDKTSARNNGINILFFTQNLVSHASLNIVRMLIKKGDTVYVSGTGSHSRYYGSEEAAKSQIRQLVQGGQLVLLDAVSPKDGFKAVDNVHCVIAWIDQGLDRNRALHNNAPTVDSGDNNSSSENIPGLPSTSKAPPVDPSQTVEQFPSTLSLLNDELELRSMLDLNVFPMLSLLQACAEYARQKEMAPGRSSINLISIAAQLPFQSSPTTRVYSASRWACSGLATCAAFESFAQGHTLKTCLVDLGLQSVRQDSPNAVALAYTIGELAHCGAPPLRLPFGKHALKMVRDRVRGLVEEIEDWKYLFDSS